METLANGILEVVVSERGAELQSIYKITSHREYLWQGDAKYWGKRSPLLFPIVGNVHDQTVLINGTKYPMTRHGFGQKLIFRSSVEDRLLHLTATDTEETFSCFPFHFLLEVLYKLSRNTLTVTLRVTHTGEGIMPFQIGNHPAFNLPSYQAEETIHGYLSCNTENGIVSNIIQEGFLTNEVKNYVPEDGLIPITNHLFEYDTLVDTRGLIERTTLYDKKKKPLVTIKAHTPITAFWSPVQKSAPFLCIEPWQGCSEDIDFQGNMNDRRFMNLLKGGETFESSMQIIIE